MIFRRAKLDRPPVDRLFALLDARARLKQGRLAARGAAVILHPLPQAEFAQVAGRAEAIVQAAASNGGTSVERSDDPHRFRWLVLRNADLGELVAEVHEVSAALELDGWWRKLLCAAFSFKDHVDRPVYWVYNYKLGGFYPVAPATGKKRRDVQRERLMSAQLEAEVTAPPELGAWFPLWGVPV